MTKDDIIFITGATAGFGEACARKFAKDGARLILLGRRKERLDKLAGELGCPAHLLPLDIRDRAKLEQAVRDLPKDFKNVTLLLNNAGLGLGMGPAHQANIDDWETMIATNITALTTLTRLILPGMVERKRGHVINMSSTAASYPYPGGNVYGATKAFVTQFSLNLRADLLGTGVRVTSIEPGMCLTEFSEVRFKGDKKAADDVYRGMKPLSANDIAETIYWCANQPEHVNVNRIELMPTAQTFAFFAVHREP